MDLKRLAFMLSIELGGTGCNIWRCMKVAHNGVEPLIPM
jgi:hypothetical protein